MGGVWSLPCLFTRSIECGDISAVPLPCKYLRWWGVGASYWSLHSVSGVCHCPFTRSAGCVGLLLHWAGRVWGSLNCPAQYLCWWGLGVSYRSLRSVSGVCGLPLHPADGVRSLSPTFVSAPCLAACEPRGRFVLSAASAAVEHSARGGRHGPDPGVNWWHRPHTRRCRPASAPARRRPPPPPAAARRLGTPERSMAHTEICPRQMETAIMLNKQPISSRRT